MVTVKKRKLEVRKKEGKKEGRKEGRKEGKESSIEHALIFDYCWLCSFWFEKSSSVELIVYDCGLVVVPFWIGLIDFFGCLHELAGYFLLYV